jgi:GGDEF domain-containing protein
MAKSRFGWSGDKKPESPDRRLRATPGPLTSDQVHLDPVLGTYAWTSLADILEADKSAGYGGALLVVDLDSQSRALAARIGEERNEILPLLARSLGQAIRSSDIIAHLENCRFSVLLRGAPADVAQSVAERVLESVRNTVFMVSEGIAPLSVEVGGVLFDGMMPDAHALLHSATANLDLAGASHSHSVIG